MAFICFLVLRIVITKFLLNETAHRELNENLNHNACEIQTIVKNVKINVDA